MLVCVGLERWVCWVVVSLQNGGRLSCVGNRCISRQCMCMNIRLGQRLADLGQLTACP